MENVLPWELIEEILLRMPVEALLRFKCVSKLWKDLINDPKFIKLHLNRSLEQVNSNNVHSKLDESAPLRSINCDFSTRLHFPTTILGSTSINSFNEVFGATLVGSCNGLVCFTTKLDKGDNYIVLYNPATRAYKRLPKQDIFHNYYRYTEWVGFGYDNISDDYKVLRIVMYHIPSRPNEFKSMIYSLKTNAWNIIKNPPCYSISKNIVWANNCLYWLDPDPRYHNEIKSLDLFTHEYHRMPLPKRISSYLPRLTVLRGQLCIVTYYLDVWILLQSNNNNIDGGINEWTRLFLHRSRDLHGLGGKLLWEDYDTSFGCVQDGHTIIIVAVNGRLLKEHLIHCNLETEEVTTLELEGLHFRDRRMYNVYFIQPWVKSLVPLVN